MRKNNLIFSFCILFLLAGVGCAFVYFKGMSESLYRDPILRLNLARADDRQSQIFKSWLPHEYRLRLNFNTDPVSFRSLPWPLLAKLHFRIIKPNGKIFDEQVLDTAFWRESYRGPMDEISWHAFKTYRLPAALGSWRFEAEVLTPDPRYEDIPAEIIFWKVRKDKGMGGMASFVFLFPASFFLAAALALGVYAVSRAQ